MFIYLNPNPAKILVGDCVIRAISISQDRSWLSVYDDICSQGRELYDMPSSNEVWGQYLKGLGYKKRIIPDNCPNCYTLREFANDNPIGNFIVGTGTHVICVINGNYYDTWDSGDEVPIYYFERRY